MPDAAPQPPTPAQGHEPPPPTEDAAPTETARPEPADEGALFHALVNAGAEAGVAYTADQRIRTMTAATVATQLQPFLVEMRQMFANHERRVDERFAALERRFDERFATQDRKLDVLTARVDGLKVLVHVVLGALALLVTALIAIFGILFTT